MIIMALYLSGEPACLSARAPSGFCHHHKKFDLKLKLEREIRIIPRGRLSGGGEETRGGGHSFRDWEIILTF